MYPDNIVPWVKEDNFRTWFRSYGPLNILKGENVGCGSPDCQVGCDCDRLLRFGIWCSRNLIAMKETIHY